MGRSVLVWRMGVVGVDGRDGKGDTRHSGRQGGTQDVLEKGMEGEHTAFEEQARVVIVRHNCLCSQACLLPRQALSPNPPTPCVAEHTPQLVVALPVCRETKECTLLMGCATLMVWPGYRACRVVRSVS